jgi:predicted HicB family RNase H-like nuclease
MMKYKGYIGIARIDADARVIRGHVVNTRDTITFQGNTVVDAEKAFKASVDDYLEFCKSLGEPPEKPFSGQFVVRLTPAIHRDLTAVAQSKGISVNKMVTGVLKRVAKTGKASIRPAVSNKAKTVATRTKKPRASAK